ncbi:unnamed protein product [Brassica oleracea]|uniref:(rape) hypothetical protein n=1 Tax=Brassica napus TaxID=3708 RepID=A0A816KV84_BRANA|nr:unnamed protein product [Brassica napus]
MNNRNFSQFLYKLFDISIDSNMEATNTPILFEIHQCIQTHKKIKVDLHMSESSIT